MTKKLSQKNSQLKFTSRKQHQSAFTIVELLIVIVVIAILAAITIVAYNGIINRASNASIQSSLQTAAKKLGVYNATNNTYPDNLAAAGVTSPGDVISRYSKTGSGFCLIYSKNSVNYSVTNAGTVSEGICQAGSVTTFAGSGEYAYADGTGTAAKFFNVSGLAIDASGNIFVADSDAANIRKITPAGVVTTVAGSTTGETGRVDDTGTAARFNYPNGIAIDVSGNLYVADTFNYCIRKITPGGVVTTIAGSLTGQSGLVNSTTSTAARFLNPSGITIDASGNLYVADTGNNNIRKVTPAGAVTSIAGSATGASGATDDTGTAARFKGPSDITIDGSGNLYVADSYNHNIRKVTQVGVVTTFAGSGSYGYIDATGSAAQFNFPQGIAVDNSGTLYVVDTTNGRIRKITSTGVVTTLAGSGATATVDGSGLSAGFYYPTRVAVNSTGIIYVSDGSSVVRKIE